MPGQVGLVEQPGGRTYHVACRKCGTNSDNTGVTVTEQPLSHSEADAFANQHNTEKHRFGA